MNDGSGLDLAELRRQLTDLAESVETEQPWQDPLPYVLRAAMEDLETESQSGPGPFAAARGRVAKIGWPRFNPVPLISVAAVFLVIALIGVLVHGGGDDSKKSAESGPATSAAAAAGGAAAAQTSSAAAVPGTRSGINPRALSCGTLAASSKLAITAPGELVQRGVIRVRVTTTGGIRLTSPTVVVRLASGVVVGRLVPIVATPAPTDSGSVSSFVVTGRLVRTSLSCDDLPGQTIPRPVSPLAAALPPGHYQLVVTGSTGTARAASAPVAITIHR